MVNSIVLKLDGILGPVYREVGDPRVGEVTCGGSPLLTCKRDQVKMRDYMVRRVTSPTWGPPPPCKQALKLHAFAGNQGKDNTRKVRVSLGLF